MTRGKHAARASKARADKAEQELAELKSALLREREEWSRERAQLKSEVQRLANKNRAEIDTAAADEIQAAEVRHAHELKAERERWTQKAVEVTRYLDEHDVRMTIDDHLAIAEILGIGMFQRKEDTRILRRLTPKKARRNESMMRQKEGR